MKDIIIDKTGWKKCKFGDVAIQTKGIVDIDNTDLTRYIAGEHMNSEDIHLRKWGNVGDGYLGPAFIRRFNKGDILYGSRRTYLKKVAIADFDGITANTTFVIKAKEELIEPILLVHLMLSDSFTEYSVKNSRGSVNPYINWKDIADYEFLLPPKEEQKRLAELLWAADEMIEKEKKELEKVKSYSDALQTNIFQTNINQTTRLCDIANIIMGQSPDGSSYNELKEGVPFLQGNSEFTAKYPIAVKYTTVPTKMANVGDILMSVRAPVGAINIADKSYCIGRGLCAISSKSGNNNYLRFLIQSKLTELDRISTGSTFKAINSNDLKNLEVPIDEKDISLLLECEKVITNLNYCICKCKQLKQELINKIF